MKPYYYAYNTRYQQIHDMNLEWAANTQSPIVQEIIQRYGIKTSDKILEIGCGEGRDAIWLLKNHYRLLASDVSEEAIRYCQQKFPQFRDSFVQLDVCRDDMQKTFDFIYSIAVIHMLVDQNDRNIFLTFIRNHLNRDGHALILSMGDGETERSSDPSKAFENASRIHQETGKEVCIASTSCRIVSFPSFTKELEKSGLEIVEKGFTSIIPDFPQIMYALVKREEQQE